jgi:large subunit ribosomal protein L15
MFEDGSLVDHKALAEKGIVRGRVDEVKVLGQGELKKRLEVVAHAFSASAKAKIEAAQGTVKMVARATTDAHGESAAPQEGPVGGMV